MLQAASCPQLAACAHPADGAEAVSACCEVHMQPPATSHIRDLASLVLHRRGCGQDHRTRVELVDVARCKGGERHGGTHDEQRAPLSAWLDEQQLLGTPADPVHLR